MKKEKKLSPQEAADVMLREMVLKFGVKFIADFIDVDYNTPLYVALCEYGDGEIKPTPFFPRRDVAETFVELCRKYIPGFKNKNVRIYKLKEVCKSM